MMPTMRGSELSHRLTFHRLGFIVSPLCAQASLSAQSLGLGRWGDIAHLL